MTGRSWCFYSCFKWVTFRTWEGVPADAPEFAVTLDNQWPGKAEPIWSHEHELNGLSMSLGGGRREEKGRQGQSDGRQEELSPPGACTAGCFPRTVPSPLPGLFTRHPFSRGPGRGATATHLLTGAEAQGVKALSPRPDGEGQTWTWTQASEPRPSALPPGPSDQLDSASSRAPPASGEQACLEQPLPAPWPQGCPWGCLGSSTHSALSPPA